MNNQLTNNSIYDTTIRLFILILIVTWCLLIMSPFVSVILWSLILALALFPLHKGLSKKIGGRTKLASFIIVIVILGIIILPTFLMIDSLVVEVEALKQSYDKGALSIPPPTEKVKDWPVIGEKFYDIWQDASFDIKKIIFKYKGQLLTTGSKIASGVLSAAGGVFQIIISLLIASILLTVGGASENIRKFFRKVAGPRGDEFADITIKTVGSVVKGIIGVALIMALLNGIILMMAGIPYAGICTLLMFVLCVIQIPVIIVTVPIIIYMFAVKETVPAVIWSILMLLAGLSDNVLRPIMLGKGAAVPMLVIFIGVIGGFILSGFTGLFTGAIVMSIGYKLYDGWINSADQVETDKISEQAK